MTYEDVIHLKLSETLSFYLIDVIFIMFLFLLETAQQYYMQN